ncbi:MAG: uracil-DNA glycosylase [Acidobacteriota bacterium]|jgi:DNA polymerase|nr:uracil-DNA glycosylase [Acidobacteriota bacterium]MDQ3372379.1 uracil-DNA glycosylase [Acidobacteriota bacterium]
MSTLFDLLPAESNENVDNINQEILRKGKILFSEKFFIFGTGKTDAPVVVVGESPGLPDADSEKPFMGPVGQLLEKILKAIGILREECYLTNVVKFISQGDEITPDILKFFIPYLHREMLAIKPKVIISLGNTPTKALLNTKKAISQIRGEFYDYHGIKLMPTFNPAYILRDPSKKREVWEDMKLIKEYLNEK